MTPVFSRYFTYNTDMGAKSNIILILLTMFLFAAAPGYAQSNKNIKYIAKGLRTASTQETASGLAPKGASPRALNAAMVRFANRYKRNLFKLQVTAGVSPRRAISNLTTIGALPTKRHALPTRKKADAFLTRDLGPFAYPSGPIPSVPFTQHPHYMYRGLGLDTDGKALRNILENGLRTQDVGRDNNTRRLSYAALGGRGTLQTVASQPVINLTNSPSTALHYAQYYQEKGLLVLVVIKEKVKRGRIITTPEDIPARNIQAVAALLSVNGKPSWCQIELEEKGFLITPYASAEKSTK